MIKEINITTYRENALMRISSSKYVIKVLSNFIQSKMRPGESIEDFNINNHCIPDLINLSISAVDELLLDWKDAQKVFDSIRNYADKLNSKGETIRERLMILLNLSAGLDELMHIICFAKEKPNENESKETKGTD